MSWIDIVIIALVVLFGLAGVIRGLKKSALSLGAFLVAFVLAFFLANVVAEAFMGIDSVKAFVLGNGVGEGADWSLAQVVYTGLANTENISSEFILTHYYQPILERIASANLEIGLDVGLAIYIAFLMFSVICGIGIFIVSRFLLMIVTAIVKSYIDKKKSVLSRVLGFAVGVVRGGVLAIAITAVFSCLCGLPFIVGFDKIEDEYEHPNAVLCGYVNEAAYGLRNKLFLPDADMYGRIVELVYGKEPEEPAGELPLKRLQLFVDVSNLNYTNQPYDIDENHKRTFDEENAIKLGTYENLGFENVMNAIAAYNTQAANIIDDTTVEIDEQTLENYSGFVQTNSTCLFNLTNALKAQLDTYSQHYSDGQRMVADGADESAIGKQNRTLETDYNNVCDTLNSLFNAYANVSAVFGEFPKTDIAAMIPDSLQL